ncbi:hypothetical protein BH11ACT3_BH11ACT3_24680 [soil metagenome]
MPRIPPPVAGAVIGLAWSAALRAYMSVLAGDSTHFDVVGTFAQILLPGIVVGALLGWAETIRRRGGAPHWRLLALSPLLFFLAAMLTPCALVTFLSTGVGGGSLGIVLIALLGGFALGDVGRRWLRVAALVAGVVFAAGLAAAPLFAGVTAERAWATVLAASLMPILAWASAIPFSHHGAKI